MHAMTLLSAAYRLLGSLGLTCLMLMDSKWQAAQQIYVAVKEFEWTATTATVCTNTWTAT